jgi:hypothetical protein
MVTHPHAQQLMLARAACGLSSVETSAHSMTQHPTCLVHCCPLQAIYTIKLGRFDELTKSADGVNVLVSSMEELAQQLEGQQLEYTWMPPQLYMPLVQLLAAVVLRPQASTDTNFKRVQLHISRGG